MTLYRYSDHARVTAFVTEGRVSFNHARNYTAGELTPGQRDNEQERLYTPDVRNLQVAVGSPGQGASPLTNLTNFKLTVNIPAIGGAPLGYYLLCCSHDSEPWMFAEFKADAFIEFHDPAEFFRRLQVAAHDQFPGFGCHGRTVEYYSRSSLPAKTEAWEFIFCKDDTFAGQREFRFTLVGPQDQSADDRKELLLGSLADICSVVHNDA
jgi:hypothetical protein